MVCTSTDHAGGSAQGQKDKEPQRKPPWGDTPRLSRGMEARQPWRKRGGKKQKDDPYYNTRMADIARNKGKGKGGPFKGAWYT